MQIDGSAYTLPRWRLTRWLAEPPPGTPEPVRRRLIATLYSGLPVFFGGIIATVVGPATVAIFRPSIWFAAWLFVEVVISAVRLGLLVHGPRASRRGRGKIGRAHV